jgi:hypothetical protein
MFLIKSMKIYSYYSALIIFTTMLFKLLYHNSLLNY